MRPFLTLMTILIATASVGLVAGAPVGTGDLTNETALDPAAECTETINEHTAICSAELDGSDVVIDLYTEGQQRIVVTEAFRKGSGVLSQRQIELSEGKNTIRMTVTVDGGSEGVTIASGDVLYQKEVVGTSSVFSGPWGPSDSQAAGLGAGLAVASLTLLMVFRARIGGNEEPERVA